MTPKQIKDAVAITQRAQRNYNLTKTIPQEDIETLIYAASNGPSKQNETHFNLRVYTDPVIIEKIHQATKLYTMFSEDNIDEVFSDKNEHFNAKEEYTITNSQIYANAVFVWCDDTANLRGGTHILATRPEASEGVRQTLFEQKAFSIGISSGQLTLTAALLGYKTGYCSAFERNIERTTPDKHLQTIIQSETEPRIIVGVGYPNEGVDRSYHATVKNKDIPERYRNGPDEQYWKHPTFDKSLKVWLNNSLYLPHS